MTEADMQKIKTLYVDEKKSMESIAKIMNISAWNVHDKLHKMGVEIRPMVTAHALEKAWEASRGRVKTAEEKRKWLEANKHGGIGNKKRMNTGYIGIYFPDHPQSKDGYVLEHRLVMECVIGRHLNNDECVHHINGNRADNRIENLQLMTQTEHKRLHMIEINERKKKHE